MVENSFIKHTCIKSNTEFMSQPHDYQTQLLLLNGCSGAVGGIYVAIVRMDQSGTPHYVFLLRVKREKY